MAPTDDPSTALGGGLLAQSALPYKPVSNPLEAPGLHATPSRDAEETSPALVQKG